MPACSEFSGYNVPVDQENRDLHENCHDDLPYLEKDIRKRVESLLSHLKIGQSLTSHYVLFLELGSTGQSNRIMCVRKRNNKLLRSLKGRINGDNRFTEAPSSQSFHYY